MWTGSHFIAATASVAVVGIAAVAIGVTTLVNKEDIVIHGEKMTSSETSDSYVYSTTSSSKVESEESIVVSSTTATTATTATTSATTISTTTAPIEIEDSSVPEEDVPEVTTVATTTSAPIEEPIEKPVESSKVEDIAEPEPVVTTVITTTSNPVETPTKRTGYLTEGLEIGEFTEQGYEVIGKTPDEGIPYIALDEQWEKQQMVIIGYASWGSPLYYTDKTAWHAAHDENVKAQVEWFEAHNGRIN